MPKEPSKYEAQHHNVLFKQDWPVNREILVHLSFTVLVEENESKRI